MSEIITLQFGSAANYVGAHYWNLQDDVLTGARNARRDVAANDATPLGGRGSAGADTRRAPGPPHGIAMFG